MFLKVELLVSGVSHALFLIDGEVVSSADALLPSEGEVVSSADALLSNEGEVVSSADALLSSEGEVETSADVQDGLWMVVYFEEQTLSSSLMIQVLHCLDE